MKFQVNHIILVTITLITIGICVYIYKQKEKFSEYSLNKPGEIASPQVDKHSDFILFPKFQGKDRSLYRGDYLQEMVVLRQTKGDVNVSTVGMTPRPENDSNPSDFYEF